MDNTRQGLDQYRVGSPKRSTLIYHGNARLGKLVILKLLVHWVRLN